MSRPPDHNRLTTAEPTASACCISPPPSTPRPTPPSPSSPRPPPPPPPAPSGPVKNNTALQSVVINQAGSDGVEFQRLLVDPYGVRCWSTGLCDCLNDLGSCLCACLICPILMCRVSNRMKECAFICCAFPGACAAMRVKLRTMGGIQSSLCRDCVVTCCCSLCAASQMSRELDAMGL
ncbi:hypothetical protein ACOMHN_020021 [Nucella lapillus]